MITRSIASGNEKMLNGLTDVPGEIIGNIGNIGERTSSSLTPHMQCHIIHLVILSH
jgi:hypothetical protein